jgi:hypothetical protein
MKRLNIATLIGLGAVASGLALSPLGAIAHAGDNEPDRPGYMECIEQQPEGPDGREEDTTIQVCCLTHNGTVEEDYGDPSGQTHWCNIPGKVDDIQQEDSSAPPKPPVRTGTDVIAPLEPAVVEPAAPTGTVRPPRVVSAWPVAALG